MPYSSWTAEVRKRLGLSIADMAKACGVHRQTWIKWEKGERHPEAAARRLISLLEWLHDQGIDLPDKHK